MATLSRGMLWLIYTHKGLVLSSIELNNGLPVRQKLPHGN